MTVIKGELNDPNMDQVSVSPDFETAMVGELDGYGENLGYVEVDGYKVRNPVEIDFLNSSVYFRSVSVDDVSHYRYSGRDYDANLFDDIIMETESMRRAPSVVPVENGYEVLDGNSYFEAFRRERYEDNIWVRVHDYSSEEASDLFLSDHIPGSGKDLEERGVGGNWYSDEEIDMTFRNLYPDLGSEIDVSLLEEIDRVGFNVDRMRWKN